MAEDSKALVLRESAAIVDAETLLQTPVAELDPETQLTAYSVLDLLQKKVIDARKDELKESLKEYAKASGEENANGSFKVAMADGGWAEARKSKGKLTVDEVRLAELLAEKGIPYDTVFKEVKTVKMDESAVEALVTLGKLTVEDLKAISTVGEDTFAFYHGKPKAVVKLLPK